jgi:DNA-directed RNA polymerase specialized sigma24 family protein
MEMNIDTALTEIYGRFNRLPASERLVEANTLIEQLREATATIAESRRAAVREMRIDGYTLREIAELIGTTTQRIHQIESGYNRHEQKARKQAD